MGTKLLEKSQLTAAKNKDTAREQAEGMKLARRVDSLREIAAQEEAALKKFRDQTLAQIKADIEKESKPLQELRKEVVILQQSRQDALKPLTEEKNEILSLREQLHKETQVLNAYREDIKKRELSVDHNLKEAENEYQRANEYQRRQAQYLQDTDVSRRNAEEYLKQAEEKKERASKLSQEILIEFASRDMQLAASERRIEMKDKAQNEREQELNQRETRLLDREKMLERNLKRK